MYKKSILIIMIFTLLLTVIPFANVEAAEPIISIKLAYFVGNRTTLSFNLSSNYGVANDNSITLSNNKTYTIKIENNRLVLYNGTTKLKDFGSSFTITPGQNNTSSQIKFLNVGDIYGKGTTYFGDMAFAIENGYIRPRNLNIPFEDYLKGVVPSEMSASRPVEALKAQAVAARTYAKSYIGSSSINDTESYQVYGGYFWNNSTYQNSNIAVDSTIGEVVRYNGNLISSVYSSSNGGITESSKNEWGYEHPYLIVQNDPYDPKNPWKVTLHKTQIDTSDLDLYNPGHWWNSVDEVDLTNTTNKTNEILANIKTWLQNNGYPNTYIKITSIPEFTISQQKNSSGRSLTGTITIRFFVRDKANNTYRMENSKIKEFSVTNNTSVNGIRSIVGGTIFKSELIDQLVSSKNTRIAGTDRYNTAIEISKKGWSSANTVLLASANNFPDALAASPLAYKLNAPILLTDKDSLSLNTKNEIERLKPQTIIIIGGQGTISDKIINELKAMNHTVKRIGGIDRYETSKLIALEIGIKDTAVLASGENFPDALAIAPYAAKQGYPILLTKSKELPIQSKELLLKVGKTYIIGGESSVSSGIVPQVINTERIAGSDRFDTATKILMKFNLSKTRIYLANGLGYADALTGSILAAKNNGSLLLSMPNELPTQTKLMVDPNTSIVTILGGSASISEEVKEKLPNEEYELAGRGYGHGVGMSQNGAYEMASRGFNYKQILEFYYKGAKVSPY